MIRRVTIVYQDDPKGLGHAVGCAREAVGDEPFAVMLPDELMSSSAVLAQMNGVCAATGGSVVAVVNVPRETVGSYGVIDPAGELTHDGVIPVRDLIEKPAPEDAPSNFILTGRYVLTADAWDEIDRLTPGSGGELQLTDALRAQAARAPFHAVVADETRLDTGTPLGFLTASIQLGLHDPELSEPLPRLPSPPARLSPRGIVTLRRVDRDLAIVTWGARQVRRNAAGRSCTRPYSSTSKRIGAVSGTAEASSSRRSISKHS